MTEPRIDLGCAGCGVESASCSSCYERLGLTKDQLLALAQEHIAPISQEARDLLDQLLRQREHETHKLAREDYLHQGGRNWLQFYDRHALELSLRERFRLPDHPFGECCEPSDDFNADVAAIGLTTLGEPAAAAEGINALGDDDDGE